ncbi:MAG: hypothetical protein RL660_2331 [Bacteroidota bacterium]
MMRLFLIVFISIILIFPQSIYAKKKKKRVSTLESLRYDSKTDKTTYLVVPFGKINLKGNWTEVKDKNPPYGKLVKNAQGVEILLDLLDCSFSFNDTDKVKNYQFVERYYNWEKAYFEKSPELKTEVIERDSINNFMIYRINGKIKNEDYDTYVFVTEKDCNVMTLLISNYVNISREEKIRLFKEIYNTE